MQVQLVQISLALGGRSVLAGLDLKTAENEYVVILGPSGCGKTTTLRIIAGLQRPDSGEVRFDGTAVTRLAPRRRGVSMVFQHNALYPHLTVEEFIRLGIAGQIPESEWQSRFQQAIDLTRIEGLLGRYPDQLSGGELRRAMLAKAIVRQSPVRLLDEPLSALDASARYLLQEDIARWHRTVPGATIHVTHDGGEAMRMADRIAVLSDGRILQVDVPDTIYRRPNCLAVARVIGSPPINLFAASVQRGQLVTHDPRVRPRIERLGEVPDGKVWLGVRPESFHAVASQVSASFPGTEQGLEVEAKLIEIRDGIQFRRVRAELDGATINGVLPAAFQASEIRSEATIRFRVNRSDLHLFEAGSGKRLLV